MAQYFLKARSLIAPICCILLFLTSAVWCTPTTSKPPFKFALQQWTIGSGRQPFPSRFVIHSISDPTFTGTREQMVSLNKHMFDALNDRRAVLASVFVETENGKFVFTSSIPNRPVAGAIIAQAPSIAPQLSVAMKAALVSDLNMHAEQGAYFLGESADNIVFRNPQKIFENAKISALDVNGEKKCCLSNRQDRGQFRHSCLQVNTELGAQDLFDLKTAIDAAGFRQFEEGQLEVFQYKPKAAAPATQPPSTPGGSTSNGKQPAKQAVTPPAPGQDTVAAGKKHDISAPSTPQKNPKKVNQQTTPSRKGKGSKRRAAGTRRAVIRSNA